MVRRWIAEQNDAHQNHWEPALDLIFNTAADLNRAFEIAYRHLVRDGDDIEHMSKASLTYAQTENNPMHRPGASALTAHPSAGVTLTPATRAASPHKFDALVDHVQNRDSCTRSEAMSRARQEYPDTYASYQDFQAASPTTEQESRRLIGKSSGPQTFEGLVSEQMRKGVTEEIARVRVINQYGSTALRDRDFAKRVGDDVADQFHKRAEDLWLDSECSRTDALRAARLAHPNLYNALRRA
jgi:hypothetical protein